MTKEILLCRNRITVATEVFNARQDKLLWTMQDCSERILDSKQGSIRRGRFGISQSWVTAYLPKGAKSGSHAALWPLHISSNILTPTLSVDFRQVEEWDMYRNLVTLFSEDPLRRTPVTVKIETKQAILTTKVFIGKVREGSSGHEAYQLLSVAIKRQPTVLT